jgi:hypothetical protein
MRVGRAKSENIVVTRRVNIIANNGHEALVRCLDTKDEYVFPMASADFEPNGLNVYLMTLGEITARDAGLITDDPRR